MSDNPYEVFNHITIAYDTCALCGRALSVAAGEPGVCSDCEAEVEALRELARRLFDQFERSTRHLMGQIDEPGSSSGTGGRGR